MVGGPFTRTPICGGAGGSGRHTGRGVSGSLLQDGVLSSVRPLSMAARRRGARAYIYIYMSRASKGVRNVHHRSPRCGPPARINWANQCGLPHPCWPVSRPTLLHPWQVTSFDHWPPARPTWGPLPWGSTPPAMRVHGGGALDHLPKTNGDSPALRGKGVVLSRIHTKFGPQCRGTASLS